MNLCPNNAQGPFGGKERLGGISKQGDGYLRRLLVVGATAVMRMARKDAARQPSLAQLLERKPAKIETVALANEAARIAWAMMSRNEVYAKSSCAAGASTSAPTTTAVLHSYAGAGAVHAITSDTATETAVSW